MQHQRAELAEARAEASSARACTVEGLLAAARAEAATSHTVGHSTSHHRAHHSQATPSSTPKTLKLSYGIHPGDAYGSTAIASAGHGHGTAGTCTYTNGSDIGGRPDGQRHAGRDSGGDGGGGIPLYRMLLEAAVAAGLEREDGLRRAAEEAVEMEMRARMVRHVMHATMQDSMAYFICEHLC